MAGVHVVMRRVRTGWRHAGLAAAVLAGLSLAAPAWAVDLKVVGVWTAFRGETSDGITICGVSSGFPDGRTFYLKWYKGDDYLVVQAYKESWQIPPKVTAKVSLKFTGNDAWTATSAASEKVSSIVEFNFPRATVRSMVKQFTTSASGTLEFAGGSEPPWVLDMSGSSGALDVMAQCMDGVAGPGADTPLAYMRRPSPAFGPTPGGQQPVPARPTQPF